MVDISLVDLPPYILEPRSQLEMYADFFAHPDMFVDIVDAPTPRDRIIAVLKWYLSAFHTGRKSDTFKKPYNPILGEVFQCWWNLGDGNNPPKLSFVLEESNSPVECCSETEMDNPSALVFCGEQVSHHPPVAAFHTQHEDKGISLTANLTTKTKFLGLYAVVQNIGEAVVTLTKPVKEQYVLGFPNGYARSILTSAWMELGGDIDIKCAQTGYFAKVEFRTKSLFGTVKHRVVSKVFSPTKPKKPFLIVDGLWNGLMIAKYQEEDHDKTEKFVDVKSLVISKKNMQKLAKQQPFESRCLWKEMTRGLKTGDLDLVAATKKIIAVKQSQEVKNREIAKETWKARMFDKVGKDKWIFRQSTN